MLEVESKTGQADKVSRNIYGTNLLMRTADGQSYYYMYNGHADVTALINTASGSVDATYYYDAFGNITESGGVAKDKNSILYAGYQYDQETKLYYLNARMYDPKIARFLQEDTYSGNPNDPLSLNLYAYCANNPLIYVDPTGHMYGYFDENGKWVGYTHSCNPAAYTVGGYNGADEYVYGSLYSKERTIIHKRTYEKVEAIDGNWATYFEEFNRDYGKPFVKDVLGIKEDSTLYKVIKKVAVNNEASLATGLNFVTGTVQGTHLMYETLLTDAQFAYLEIGKSQGWFGLDNESVRKSSEEEIYGKVEYYANIWKSVPGAIGKDILTTLNPFNNTFTRGYFSDHSLREKVEYNQARINTVTTLYGLYRGVQRFKNWRASKNAPVNTAPVENTGSTGVGNANKQTILNNIAESKAARESSNFRNPKQINPGERTIEGYYNSMLAKGNPNSIEVFNSEKFQNLSKVQGIDCSELAEYMYNNAGGKGEILNYSSSMNKFTEIKTPAKGGVYKNYFYHTVYSDGAYIYDPWYTTNPVPKDVYSNLVNSINNGSVMVEKVK